MCMKTDWLLMGTELDDERGWKSTERKTENESARVKTYTKINRQSCRLRETGTERWKNKEKERERIYPTSEVSILISTISHCSLAAGQIDRDTWLSKTSGSRKHRGTNRLKLTASPTTIGPRAFSSAQEHNATSTTQERKRRTKRLSCHGPVCSLKLHL